MRNIRSKPIWITGTVFLCLLLCLGAFGAYADGDMPQMPSPPDANVYWQLTAIEQSPEVTASGGYSVTFQTEGLSLDLGDGLLTESQLQAEDTVQGITLRFEKNGEVVMEHRYAWTPLPIYLEPGKTYPITVQGTAPHQRGNTPNSLLNLYMQGEQIARISAGGYTGHAADTSFDITTESIYTDGSFVVHMILRDVNDMFRDRIVFTYTMNDGAKPVPTPIPGFVSVPIDDPATVPDFYVPTEGRDDLWQIVTAPGEYRAYGLMTGVGPLFFPADEQGKVVFDAPSVDPQADFDAFVAGFVSQTPTEIPAHYAPAQNDRYTFITRDGDTVTRAYGRIDGGDPAYYAVNEIGEVPETADPIDPQADYEQYIRGFGMAPLPGPAPEHYEAVGDSHYAFESRDGQRRYRAYGRLNGAEPDYYPADAQGTVQEDAQPVDPQQDFESYIKGFDPVQPPELPEFYRIITEHVYAVDDREGNPVHRTYGVKDGAAPAYYPTDETGGVGEEAEPVEPDADFVEFVEGFIPTEGPSLPELPDFYEPTDVDGVWSFEDKDGRTHYRVHGSLHRGVPAFYPSDEQGEVATDALSVLPASDLVILPPPKFAAMEPKEIPTYYEIIDKPQGVYGFTDLDGNTVHRAYGAYGKAAPAFFPANEIGEPLENADAIDPDVEYGQYFGGFTAQTPQQLPAPYKAVADKAGLYSFLDKQYAPHYRMYGAKESGTPAFYPSDAEGKLLSGKPADMQADAALALPRVDSIVVTQPPQPTPGTTPLARSYESVDFWTTFWTAPPLETSISPTAEPMPESTPLTRSFETTDFWTTFWTAPPVVVGVTPAASPAATGTVLSALFTPAPTATARPMPTVSATVLQQQIQTDPPQTVTRVQETYTPPTEAPTETPTDIPQTQAPTGTATATQRAEANGGGQSTLEVVTPIPSDAVTNNPQTQTDNPATEGPTGDPATEVPTDTPATDVPTEDPATEAPTEDPATEAPTDPATEAPQPTEAATPVATEAPQESTGGISTGGWVGIGAGILIVIGGAAYFIIRRRKV